MRRPPDVPEDAILLVFRVPPESAGKRADVFLATQLRSTSRTRARAIVAATAYTPEGQRIRPSDRLRAEDRVVLWRPSFEADEPVPEIATLYEDPHLLAVDKPPKVTVHPTARHHKNTLIMRLGEQRPGEFLSLIHRLDRETSGVLLLARSAEADRAFKRALEDRSAVEMQRALDDRDEADPGLVKHLRRASARGLAKAMGKTYLALTWGVPPDGEIDAPLDIDGDNPLRVKMKIATRGAGQDARTDVRVLERRGAYALVECELHTGRQHQIRVHLASVGCPVVGDKLYGPDERLLARAADGELTAEDHALLELPRQALHAHRYRLDHAITGQPLDIVSPLPPDLAAFWASKAEPAPG